MGSTFARYQIRLMSLTYVNSSGFASNASQRPSVRVVTSMFLRNPKAVLEEKLVLIGGAAVEQV